MREFASHFPVEIERTACRAKDAARDLVGGSLSYTAYNIIGPIDGHNMGHLLPSKKFARSEPAWSTGSCGN